MHHLSQKSASLPRQRKLRVADYHGAVIADVMYSASTAVSFDISGLTNPMLVDRISANSAAHLYALADTFKFSLAQWAKSATSIARLKIRYWTTHLTLDELWDRQHHRESVCFAFNCTKTDAGCVHRRASWTAALLAEPSSPGNIWSQGVFGPYHLYRTWVSSMRRQILSLCRSPPRSTPVASRTTCPSSIYRACGNGGNIANTRGIAAGMTRPLSCISSRVTSSPAGWNQSCAWARTTQRRMCPRMRAPSVQRRIDI